ncbi:MAG: 6-phospho-beta-glucosidase [Actinomycetota bacterium]|nr:MAG: 6-phospho-beta-glucosidase [Actinomycetota bacterium]
MRMTLLGTGVRTPFVLHGLAERQAELGLTEVVLHDVDAERLRIMRALGEHLCRGWGAAFAVRAEEDPGEAIAGSRFVFSAIRVGQEAARETDERIALAHGVLGQETTGPGGFAMALRTIPAMLRYAELIREAAPEAILVNFTNPVGIVVQALCDHTDVRVVGVCDGPIEMKRSVAELLGVPPDEVHADYAGLNHAGWIHRVLVEGRDRLPEVLERYEELQRLDASWRLFSPGLVREIGMLPMEYLYFYYSREQALRNILSSGGSRGEQVARLNAALWPELARLVAAGDLAGAQAAWERAIATRHETYFARERGEPVPEEIRPERPPAGEMFEGDGYEGLATAVMVSAVQRRRMPLIVNTRNRGAIGDLREDDVVEVTCMVDHHGAHPIAQGHLPAHALELVEPLKAYERLTVEAAVEGSYAKALEALSVHPLVASRELARDLLEDYLEAHGHLLAHIRR